MLENVSYLIAIVGSVAGAAYFIGRKLVCAERTAERALATCEELEKMIHKETKHADENHRRLYDKIDELKAIMLKNKIRDK